MGERHSIHLNLAGRTYERLMSLKRATDAATVSEVVRAALRAYELQLAEREGPENVTVMAK